MYNENENNVMNNTNYNYDPMTGEYIGNRTDMPEESSENYTSPIGEEIVDNSMYMRENAQTSVEENMQENVSQSTEQVNAEESDSTYRYTGEQLENQWKPNTGTYFTEQNVKEKAPKAKKVKIKKEKKPISTGKLLAACTASALVAVVASSGVMYGLYKNNIEENYMLKSDYAAASIGNTGTALNNIAVSQTGNNDSQYEYSVEQVAEAVLPSVVSITSTAIVQSNYNPFYGGGSYQVTGAGSGIIVGKSDTELLIVTNNHVVEDTTSLTVEFDDGTSIDSAYIKGTNASNDIAVVAIKLSELKTDTLNSIKIAVLGDSDNLSVGESVIAIGNALGYGQSVTSGVVSALDREITLDTGEITVIQTDASINGGNSGGALVNRQGEVIGINVAKASSASSSSTVEGMGYAIPVSEVMDIINELMNKETKEPVAEENQGYLGLTGSGYVEVDSSTSQMYNIPVGIYIREVIEGSPIDEGGISSGDVITAVEGEEIATYDELKNAMKYYAVGDEVKLTVQMRGERAYKEKEITIKLISYEALEEMIEEQEE